MVLFLAKWLWFDAIYLSISLIIIHDRFAIIGAPGLAVGVRLLTLPWR
jgi:ABC-type phosphate transport system auxiliary subunit